MKRIMTGVWLSCALAAIPVVAAAQLRATASETAVSVSGATRSGSVAVCRIANARVNGVETIARQQKVVTADDSGIATVPAETPAFRAIWIVTDMATGDFVVALPPGYHTRVIDAPAIAHPGIASFVWSRPLAEAYVIRPHVGVWYGVAAFGRASDAGHDSHGHVTFGLAQLRANPGDPSPPAVLTPGDVLLLVDPTWMVYSAVTIPKGEPNAH